MATLAELRAKLKEAENRSSGAQMDNSIYPFWNLTETQESVVRFLPDANPENVYFWVEQLTIKLSFPDIIGDHPDVKKDDNGEIIVKLPCIEMYGKNETCPILSEVRPWWKSKDKTLLELASKYWKKYTYHYQGLIVEDGLSEEEKPENPIRRFILAPQVHNIIKAAIIDPEIIELPTHSVNGLDFRIKVHKKGRYNEYTTSCFSRRERPLTEKELEAINTYKLYDLASFLPQKPSSTELKIQQEMFEASLDGKPYDPEKWGQYYRPSGLNMDSGDSRTSRDMVRDEEDTQVEVKAAKRVSVPSTPVEQDDEPSDTGSSRADEILAMIRNRPR